ncbi:MAG: hypothetical protein KME11_04765 [Timaviella obliquedivisa GSE-PSE-MK23-08B]|jgi:hypothetical protein|nr:hypothetical protein [Timaviella obliquedivisa GSE-PSE-MK23-08B]
MAPIKKQPTPASEPEPNPKKGRGRPSKGDGSRFRVSVTLPTEEIALFQQWAEQEKLELATHLSRVIRLALHEAIASGELKPAPNLGRVKEVELLKGFLRCLAENWDTDGYSVAEIGHLLGFSGNVELDRLIEVLEKAKNQTGSRKNDRNNKKDAAPGI